MATTKLFRAFSVLLILLAILANIRGPKGEPLTAPAGPMEIPVASVVYG